MTDEDFVAEVIERLNALLASDPAVAPALKLLIDHRVTLPDDTLGPHPTIQLGHVDDDADKPLELGFLGMLNGIAGAIVEGQPRAGWGYVAAVIESDGRLSAFADSRKFSPKKGES